MSWPVFAVIQLGIVTLGVLVAAFLRNRELNRRYTELAEASDEALEAIQAAKALVETDAHVAWLSERVDALDGDDDATAISRLVLANELEANPDFESQLAERLGAAESARDALRAQWQLTRNASFDTATKLIEQYPLSHPVIVQLYEVFNELDVEFGIEPSALPDAPDPPQGDDVDPAQEAENLRAAKVLLEKEIDVMKATLENTQASGAESEEQAEDLKALLQQFTKDSRDMMECIQTLEAENQQLREQLSNPEAAVPAEDAGVSTDTEEATAADAPVVDSASAREDAA